MDNNFWRTKIVDFCLLLFATILIFIGRVLWLRTSKIYAEMSDKSFHDKFIKENEEFKDDINRLKKDTAMLKEDKRIREAIAKALEELQFKNGLS